MELSDLALYLLTEAQRRTGNGVRTLPLRRFRADYGEHLDLLEHLDQAGFFQSNHNEDQYTIPLATLPFLNDDKTRQILNDLPAIFEIIRTHYLDHLTDPLSLKAITEQTGLDIPRVTEYTHYLSDAGILSSWSTKLDDNAVITASERVAKYKTFFELLNWWQRVVHPSLRKPLKPKKIHGNTVSNASKREQILGAAVAVMAAFPENCKRGNKYSGKKITDEIEKRAKIWWPDEYEPPLQSRQIAELINDYLRTLK